MGNPAQYTRQPGFELAAGKLLITPDKPFEFRFNGQSFTVNYMTIYRPSPIRVENVQADAVLSLNDYHTAPSHVILIPLSTANTFGIGANFVDRIMANVNGIDEDDKPLAISVGNDWSLTNVLPTAQDKSGKVVVSVPYFKWSGTELVEKLIQDYWFLKFYGWRPREGDTTTIMLKDPVPVSGLTATYLQLLPYVPSDKGAPSPSTAYVYQKGKCLTCTNKPRIDPAKLEELQKTASTSKVSPSDLVKVGWTLLSMVLFTAAIFFGLDLALKGWGESVVMAVFTAMKWLVMPRPKTPVATTA